MGKTTGDFSQATSLDFARDVEAGLDYLEAQPEVNKKKIGLLGHSVVTHDIITVEYHEIFQ